jgi:VWFA-related protein
MRHSQYSLSNAAAMLGLIVIVTLSAAAQSSPHPPDLFHANTRSVVLDVFVTDDTGQPVAGLTQDVFVIREAGVPQQTRSFQAVNAATPLSDLTPRTILLIDELNTRFTDLAYVHYAINKLMHQGGATLEQPTALYMLTGRGLTVAQGYTRDPAVIDAAMRAQPVSPVWRPEAEVSDLVDRMNTSIRALQQIAAASVGVPGHKTLIWISPGFPVFSSLRVNQHARDHVFDSIRQLSDHLLQAHMSIDTVDPRGVIPHVLLDLPNTPGPQNQQGSVNINSSQTYMRALSDASPTSVTDIAIQTLAHETGGHSFFGRNDVDREIATSMQQAGSYYTLSYTPANHDFHGEFRKLQVTLVRPSNGHPTTRDGYFALRDEPSPDPNVRAAPLLDALLAPLDYSAIRIPIIYAISTGPGSTMTVHMAVSSEALTWIADGKGHFHANVIVAAASQASGKPWKPAIMTALEVAASGVSSTPPRQMAHVEFAVPYRNLPSSKVERWRVVLQDEATRRIGSSEFKLK